MKSFVRGITLWLLALFALPVNGEASEDAYRIWGNLAEWAENGEIVLSRSTEVLGSSEEIARVPLKDGRFEILGDFTHGGRVNLAVYDGEETFKGSAAFILEPTDIHIEHVGGVTPLKVHGGPYQQKVIAIWQESDAYKEAHAAYDEVMEEKKGLTEADENYQELLDLSWERYRALQEIRSTALREIVDSDDDPLASLYAIELGGMGGEEAITRLNELQETLGAHPVLLATRNRRLKGMEMSAAARTMVEGARVEDFSSIGLDGKTYRLQDALDVNQYVLVEFWASWCGPCRAANPELIESYAKYHERGFEVFAFSLDDDREDWEQASIEDEIPWINTSDLKAYDSDVPTQFGVLAIPMNYLLDSQGGVVAKNLRSETLDEKLIELFD